MHRANREGLEVQKPYHCVLLKNMFLDAFYLILRSSENYAQTGGFKIKTQLIIMETQISKIHQL